MILTFWTMFWPRVVLICFPKQCHPLWHGECWWCSVSEKHILLLFQNFVLSGWYLFCMIWCWALQTSPGGGPWQPHHSCHLLAALWDACVYTGENMGVLETYDLWVFEGGRALLGCLSDPELNSQIMSLYISNEISWYAVRRDRIRYWATLKK